MTDHSINIRPPRTGGWFHRLADSLKVQYQLSRAYRASECHWDRSPGSESCDTCSFRGYYAVPKDGWPHVGLAACPDCLARRGEDRSAAEWFGIDLSRMDPVAVDVFNDLVLVWGASQTQKERR